MNFIKEEDSSNECKTNDNSVSKTFERNIKKKNFSKIISKLNEDRKKAQHSNSYSLNPIDINSPSNIYQLSKPKDNGITTARLKIENQFSPSINSSRSFSEDKFKAKKFKSFAEELKELKEQMLELRNQSPIQKIVKRPLLKLDLEKVQTGEELKFTLSHSSRKYQNDYPMPKNDVSVRGVDDFDMRKLIPRQKQLNLKNK